MGGDRKKTGRLGEQEACEYLMSLGHTILERNWRHARLELDIISLDKEGLHFVEVKTRRAPALASPEINVNFGKRRHMAGAAAAYLSSGDHGDLRDCEVFFDIISILFEGEEAHIEYYPKAFIPIYA